jgi:hypothetical protein
MMRHKRFILCFCIGILTGSLFSLEAWATPPLLPKEPPKGWILVEGPRVFTKANLFEHINGQAELFFKYGFQRCTFVVYKDRSNPDQQIDLDIYDMGNVLQAFGIFSRFREEDRPMDIGLDSTLDDHSALFYQGKYYVALYATEPNPDVLKQLARKVSENLSDPSPPPREISFFPKEDLKPGSIQYVSEGLLGHQFLKRGFRGNYADGDKEFQLFLAVFKNPEEAKTGLRAFRNYLSTKGKIAQEIPAGFGPDALRGKAPYQGDILVLQKASYLVGVASPEFGGKEEARLTDLVNRVR